MTQVPGKTNHLKETLSLVHEGLKFARLDGEQMLVHLLQMASLEINNRMEIISENESSKGSDGI